MTCLLDANVLIDANRDYYPLDRVPEFWLWLEHHGMAGNVKIPLEVLEELRAGDDALARWAKLRSTAEALLLEEEPDPVHVRQVIETGYAVDLLDDEIQRLGKDPFLVAYALVAPADRCVVSTERSRPRRQRANRHLPDVCASLGVRCVDTFQLTRDLDFRTNWRAP
jgi:hypothetical protein